MNPISLADRRAARATRRIRAGRIPSDFAPIDYAADPSLPPEPIEGPGVPWPALVFIACVLVSILTSAVYGVRCFFFHP